MQNTATLVFPAYAGVSPCVPASQPDIGCIPRLCGGEPIELAESKVLRLYSPPMRG